MAQCGKGFEGTGQPDPSRRQLPDADGQREDRQWRRFQDLYAVLAGAVGAYAAACAVACANRNRRAGTLAGERHAGKPKPVADQTRLGRGYAEHVDAGRGGGAGSARGLCRQGA